MMKKFIFLSLVLSSISLVSSTEIENEASENKEEIMKFFNEDIFEAARSNDNFRKELVTGDHSQVVVMSIPVGGEIGQETHKVDQVLIFVEGMGQAILNGVVSNVSARSLVFVPAGTEHNFKNTGDKVLKLFTIYAPPQHKPGTVEKNKPETEEYD